MSLQTYVDGVEVTSVTQSADSTHKLNRPWEATARFPIDYAPTDLIGKRLKLYDADLIPLGMNPLDHHGTILHVSDNDEEDTGTVEVTSINPMELWQWRPARDSDGDFSKPTFIADFVTGPQIIEEILTNSVSAGAGPPTDAEGDLFIAMGSFAGGGADLSGAPADWPMTIMEIAALLTETGELDIVLTPIDAGGNMAQVDCYNGDYGVNRSTSVVFQYATGVCNVRQLRRTQDMTTMVNKSWYYLGPKIDDQHWQGSITGDGYPDGSGGSLPLDDPPGGDIGFSNPLGNLISASRSAYGVRMEISIKDAYAIAAAPLWARTWQNESILRAQPRTLVHITPIRGLLPDFDIGDIIGVEAGAVFRGGFTGSQRVYQRKLSWDENGTAEIAEIVSSEDQDSV